MLALLLNLCLSSSNMIFYAGRSFIPALLYDSKTSWARLSVSCVFLSPTGRLFCFISAFTVFCTSDFSIPVAVPFFVHFIPSHSALLAFFTYSRRLFQLFNYPSRFRIQPTSRFVLPFTVSILGCMFVFTQPIISV